MPIALVTGASRGVGRGVAIGLAEAGFTVYATGRSIETAELPDGVIRLRCDHSVDAETSAVFEQIPALDVLVNCAWGGYERMVENGQFTWGLPFWQQPMHRWAGMMDAGVRASFVCSSHAAAKMVPQGHGLIVNIGFWPAQKYVGNAVYGVAKAATDKLTSDMSHELKKHGVAVVSLYPGLVRTESVLEAAKGGWLDLSNSESPEFIGRVVAALYTDEALMRRSGGVVVAAQAALDLDVTDVDGKSPKPLTLDSV